MYARRIPRLDCARLVMCVQRPHGTRSFGWGGTDPNTLSDAIGKFDVRRVSPHLAFLIIASVSLSAHLQAGGTRGEQRETESAYAKASADRAENEGKGQSEKQSGSEEEDRAGNRGGASGRSKPNALSSWPFTFYPLNETQRASAE